MKKQLLILLLTLTSLIGFSQTTYVVHAIDQCVQLTNVSASATYLANDDNPNTTGNTSVKVSSLLAGTSNDNAIFELPTGVNAGDTFSLTFMYYTASANAGKIIVRMFNDDLGSGPTRRINLPTVNPKVDGVWTEYTYGPITLPNNTDESINASKLFNRLQISPSNSATVFEKLYFDDMEMTVDHPTPTYLTPTDAALSSDNQWYYNYSPDEFSTVATWGGNGSEILETAVATPTTDGNNSPTVLKYTRNDNDATTGLKFSGKDYQYNLGDGKITVRIYPVCNAEYGTPNIKIRARYNNAAGTQIQHGTNPELTAGVWNEVSLDLTDEDNQDGIAADGLYNEIYLIFNQPTNIDTDGNPAVFYIDALQTPIDPATVSVGDIISDDTSLQIYPTLVENSFNINAAIISADIYNITGQKVKSYGAQTNFEASDLIKGIYFFQAKLIDGNTQTVRFVKK